SSRWIEAAGGSELQPIATLAGMANCANQEFSGNVMSEARITYRGTVYPWHCDHMGHMNVMWYVGKFDEATWQLFTALGAGPSFLRDANRGMAAVEQHCRYRRELHAGDVVTIRSEVL